MIAVHGRSAAGRQQARPWPSTKQNCPGAHVEEEDAGDGLAAGVGNERQSAVFLQPLDRPRPHLLHEAVDDLDAGEVALVYGAIEGLPGESLAVQRAVRQAIEKTADLVLEFLHPLDRLGHQGPGELLVAAAICRPRSCP